MSEDRLYSPGYKRIAGVFHKIIFNYKQEDLVGSVGPLKQINQIQFQFQATVYRDLESEMNGNAFPGFKTLVSHISEHLGKPKQRSENAVVWETINPEGDSVRISMVAYDDGSAETHSVKITVGPLKSDLL